MARNSGMVSSIDKVVERAREKYEDLMGSKYVARDIKIDGYQTKGQLEDNDRYHDEKTQHLKKMTCLLDAPIKRGSLIEIKRDNNDEEYALSGVVYREPTKTPVDYYFTALLFNTVATRHRSQLIYDEDGYVIDDNPLIVDEIKCFVQRIGMRERQIDAGIDRDSVNEIITTNEWDLKLNDILYIGSDSYQITDVKELDDDLFYGYMSYYRV